MVDIVYFRFFVILELILNVIFTQKLTEISSSKAKNSTVYNTKMAYFDPEGVKN